MKKTIHLHNAQQGHEVITKQLWPWCKNMLLSGYKLTITAGELKRSLEQNAAQWPYLQAFSEQKKVRINGNMVKATADDWKAILTAVYLGEIRSAEYDGRVIMLPKSTKSMGKKEFSDWLDFLAAMAAKSDVVVYPCDKVEDENDYRY